MEITIGLKGNYQYTVKDSDLATNWGNDVPVLATPVLLWLAELTCVKAIDHISLERNALTVGYSHQMRHLSPAYLGDNVSFEATLTSVNGNKLVFNVKGYNGSEKVLEGIHERYLINKEKYNQKYSYEK
ncbi:hypothetical protein J9303_20625 [Bacillaceae bacterium Marseille-Q3522]|nr:hypothetical protein [Bacillaceae bacterium Marseille-Q3522]